MCEKVPYLSMVLLDFLVSTIPDHTVRHENSLNAKHAFFKLLSGLENTLPHQTFGIGKGLELNDDKSLNILKIIVRLSLCTKF